MPAVKIMVAVILISVILLGSLIALQHMKPYASAEADRFIDPCYSLEGYVLENSSINHQFSNGSGPFRIGSIKAGATYSLSSSGLKITPNTANGLINVVPTTLTNASTVSIQIKDLQNIDANDTGVVSVQFGQYPKGNNYYELYLIFDGRQRIGLLPDYYPATNIYKTKDIYFNYYLKEADILVQVVNGVIHCGINGIDYQMPVNYVSGNSNDLYVKNIAFGSGSPFNSPFSFNVTKISISKSSNCSYYDKLHKTITPWGYDFTYSMQFHADNTHPDHLLLLEDLTRKYGIKGEFAGWMSVHDPDKQYSIKTNQSYKERLLELKSLGWDIGLHAVTGGDSNRSTILSLINEFEKTFGDLDSWVDHDGVDQDIWRYGNDPSSKYYIADYLSTHNIMIWVNEERHSHSKGMDLNKDQVFYHLSAYPGLNLQKVSENGVWTFFSGWDASSAPTTIPDMNNRLKAFAAEGSVILLHDYTDRLYFYIEKDGTKYASGSLPNMGYAYTPISSAERAAQGANVYNGGTWHILEPLIILYDTMANYKVWYTTPRAIWDRARYVQDVNVLESSTAVKIVNPTTVAIKGLTLTTVSEPQYALLSNGTYFYPTRGSQNWHFVIDEIPKEGELILQKVPIPSLTPSVMFDSIPVALWGSDKQLKIYALETGKCHVNWQQLNYTGDRIIDLSTGCIMQYINGSNIFNATTGHTYLVQEM